MELIKDDQRLRELHDIGVGYIYNDFGGQKESATNREFNILHRAHCSQCDPRRDHNAMTTKTQGQKIFFESSREAANWLLENRSGNYSRCTICNA